MGQKSKLKVFWGVFVYCTLRCGLEAFIPQGFNMQDKEDRMVVFTVPSLIHHHLVNDK